MIELILRDVEVEGHGRVDVAVDAGRIVALAKRLPERGRNEIEGRGGALIPGLWDHHLHLFGAAARFESLAVGPADTPDSARFAAALREASAGLEPGRWLRAVDYDEAVAGELDAETLDRILPDRPLRVQHRTGALWVLNSAALAVLEGLPLPPGAGRRADGRPDGRFLREDAWLRDALPSRPPSLAPIARFFDRVGVTGVTDASVTTDAEAARRIAEAAAEAGMRQRLMLMSGTPDLPADPRYRTGPVKLLLDDADLPSPDDVAARIAAAHAAGRAVAVHCVTAAELAVALAGLALAGARPGDRIEHGGIVDSAAAEAVGAAGLTVVTQPGFIAARGDRYLATVAAEDRPHLYPCASLLARGVAIAGSSDAPYGPLDPWEAMRAAVTRRTRSGRPLGLDERVPPRRALGLWLGSPEAPGGAERRVARGEPADLCLLRTGLAEALDTLSADLVRRTIIDGRL